jgi:endonuclease/exonuclease/phosphatase family metal-dependent hydrolase
MYDCYKKDVINNQHFQLRRSQDGAPGSQFRVVSFNVHFFTRGYSSEAFSDNSEEVEKVLVSLNADVVFLQEVPESLLGPLGSATKMLNSLGYMHTVVAGSSDVHVLPVNIGGAATSYGGMRLHVVVASRSPYHEFGAVPMGEGHAAFGVVNAMSPAYPPKLLCGALSLKP